MDLPRVKQEKILIIKRNKTTNSTLVKIGQKNYYVGGSKKNKVLSNFEMYDNSTKEWTTLPPMLEPRMRCAVTIHDGCLYVCGGQNQIDAGNRDAVLDTLECYDFTTKSWTRLCSMTKPRTGAALVGFGDHLYAIGGYSSSSWRISVEEYSLSTGSWSRHEVRSTKVAHKFPSSVAFKGKIYIYGNGLEEYHPHDRFVGFAHTSPTQKEGFQLEIRNDRMFLYDAFATSISEYEYVLERHCWVEVTGNQSQPAIENNRVASQTSTSQVQASKQPDSTVPAQKHQNKKRSSECIETSNQNIDCTEAKISRISQEVINLKNLIAQLGTALTSNDQQQPQQQQSSASQSNNNVPEMFPHTAPYGASFSQMPCCTLMHPMVPQQSCMHGCTVPVQSDPMFYNQHLSHHQPARPLQVAPHAPHIHHHPAYMTQPQSFYPPNMLYQPGEQSYHHFSTPSYGYRPLSEVANYSVEAAPSRRHQSSKRHYVHNTVDTIQSRSHSVHVAPQSETFSDSDSDRSKSPSSPSNHSQKSFNS